MLTRSSLIKHKVANAFQQDGPLRTFGVQQLPEKSGVTAMAALSGAKRIQDQCAPSQATVMPQLEVNAKQAELNPKANPSPAGLPAGALLSIAHPEPSTMHRAFANRISTSIQGESVNHICVFKNTFLEFIQDSLAELRVCVWEIMNTA